jgi:HK97 family phage portal protein
VVSSGCIKVPGELSDDAYARLRKNWDEHHAKAGSRHKALILEGGAEFQPFTLDHEESQLLGVLKYRRSTLAGVLRVPAHMVNDLEKATFSNIEHQDLGFVKHCLTPWLTNWEQEMRKALLTPEERKGKQVRYEFHHDTTSLLKGDLPSRMTAYGTAIQNGIMNPNEVRLRERLNPYVGGDTFTRNTASAAIDQNGNNKPIEQPAA